MDALASELVATKLGEDYNVKNDFSQGRSYVWQKPGDRLGVRETKAQIIDELPLFDDAVYCEHF
jgi:hypothetical protein